MAGDILVLTLHFVQWLASGYAEHSLRGGLVGVPYWRRVLAAVVGGLVVGLAWWWLRRNTTTAGVNPAVADPKKRITFLPTAADSVTQIVGVACGASVGREVAPRQLAAAMVEHVCRWLGLDDRTRTFLLAASAASGFAAVYNIPLAGAIFTFEVIGVTLTWRRALIAVVVCGIAAVLAWPVVGEKPSYELVRQSAHRPDLLVAALLVPCTFLVGALFVRMTKAGSRGAAELLSARVTWRVVPWTVVAMGLIGVLSIWWPTLPGNGKPQLQAFLLPTHPSVWLLLGLLVLKPLMTALCFRASIKGGQIAPALATGGALGGLVAMLIGHGASVPIAAIVGAAALLAYTQHAPLMASVMGVEMTQPPVAIGILVLACGLTVGLVRYLAPRARRLGLPHAR